MLKLIKTHNTILIHIFTYIYLFIFRLNIHITSFLLISPQKIIRNLKSRRQRCAGYVARMEQYRNAYTVLVGKPEGKRPLGRTRRRWEENIKII